MALNPKTFITRTITAIVFVAVLLGGICTNYITFSALFLIISLGSLFEFYKLTQNLGFKAYKTIGMTSGFLLFIYAFVINSNLSLFFPTDFVLPVILLLLFTVFACALFDKQDKPFLNAAVTITGIFYCIVPFVLLIHIPCIDKAHTFNHPTNLWYHDFAPYNFHFVLGIILLIWLSDVAAYIVGSLIGKHKLFERISPGKTWEGSVGASIITVGCAYIVSVWFPELAYKHWVVIALMVCVFGTIGDLIESMLKRQANVKDSGSIMPGHGGFLDRFDSLLFASPFIYAYLTTIKSFY